MSTVLDSILSLPGWAAYGVIGLVVFAEAAVFVGLVLPGETALLLGGALAATGRVSLPVLLAVGVVAAVVGDTVGYEVGRLSGARLRTSRLGRLGGTPVLVLVAVLVAAVAGRRTRSWRPVIMVAVTAAGSTLVTVAGKAAVHRGRPSVAEAVTGAGGFSFPSGHSLNSAAVYGVAAVLVCQLAQRRLVKVSAAAGAVLLVLLVGLSRLYLGVHWLTDVLAAYALALGWLAVVVTAFGTLGRLPARPAPTGQALVSSSR